MHRLFWLQRTNHGSRKNTRAYHSRFGMHLGWNGVQTAAHLTTEIFLCRLSFGLPPRSIARCPYQLGVIVYLPTALIYWANTSNSTPLHYNWNSNSINRWVAKVRTSEYGQRQIALCLNEAPCSQPHITRRVFSKIGCCGHGQVCDVWWCGNSGVHFHRGIFKEQNGSSFFTRFGFSYHHHSICKRKLSTNNTHTKTHKA